jgi:hypothetical protein
MSGIFDQIINYAPPSLLLGTVTYKGTWSAATNTPTLVDPTSAITNGNYYVVDAAGTQFTLVFNIGDWIISNGSTWEKVDNTDAISSVFGRTGAVVGVSTDYSSVGITNTALGASNPSTVAATTVTATSTIAATGAVTGSNLSGTNTGDQTISLTGGVTGSGTGSFAATVVTNADLTGDVTSVGNATTLTNAPVIAKVLTGYSSGAGTVAATDSILQAIQKLDGNDSTNADLTGVITSSGNATSIASQTGTGTKFVVDTSPTLVTPNIGVATGTSLAAALNGSLGATTPSTVAATTISGTTLTSTVSGTEVDFVLGNNTAGRRMELGTNSGGHGYLKLRNASNTETITANAGSGLSITGTLSASGASTLTGRVTTAGGFTATATVPTVVASSANFDYNSTGSNGRLIVWGPDVSTSGNLTINVARSDGSSFVTPVSVSSTGLAITGTLSATGVISTTATGNALTITTAGATSLYQSIGNSAGNLELGTLNTGEAYVASTLNKDLRFYRYGSLMASITSTGLAVTGTLSATSDITGDHIFANGCTTGTANLPSNAGINSINDGTTVAFNFGKPSDTTNQNLGNFFNGNGTVGGVSVNGSTTSFNTSSDARLKTNIKDLSEEEAGRLIDALRPRTFAWLNVDRDGIHDDGSIGFIAQEEHLADPVFARIGAVTVGDDDPDTITKQWMRSDQALVPILVAEIQSLRKRNTAMEARLEALESK